MLTIGEAYYIDDPRFTVEGRDMWGVVTECVGGGKYKVRLTRAMMPAPASRHDLFIVVPLFSIGSAITARIITTPANIAVGRLVPVSTQNKWLTVRGTRAWALLITDQEQAAHAREMFIQQGGTADQLYWHDYRAPTPYDTTLAASSFYNPLDTSRQPPPFRFEPRPFARLPDLRSFYVDSTSALREMVDNLTPPTLTGRVSCNTVIQGAHANSMSLDDADLASEE